MKVYHRTDDNKAKVIFESGFRDEAEYVPKAYDVGIWWADRALGMDELRTKTNVVLALEISEQLVAQYEQNRLETGKDYRVFIIPSAVLSGFGPLIVHEHDWAGTSEEQMLRRARSEETRKGGGDAARWRSAIGFLRKHGLLGEFQPGE